MRKGEYLALTTRDEQTIYLRICAIRSVTAHRLGATVSTGQTSYYVVLEKPEAIFEAMTNQEVE